VQTDPVFISNIECPAFSQFSEFEEFYKKNCSLADIQPDICKLKLYLKTIRVPLRGFREYLSCRDKKVTKDRWIKFYGYYALSLLQFFSFFSIGAQGTFSCLAKKKYPKRRPP